MSKTDPTNEASATEPAGTPADASRRSALKMLTLAGGVGLGGAAAIPAARFALAPLLDDAGGGKERWIRAIRFDRLHPDEPARVALVTEERDAFITETKELGSVWLVRRGADVFCVSVVCPHLGCSVTSKPGGAFYCPCHDSTFASDGKCEKGPSPRPLDTLKTKIVDGWVHVDFKKFRMATAEKVEV
jgi:cytochrome b6-f complex iron-sulfur subunit/menaquinol-cytochrome c reductase iron-sulfur subunit